MPADPARNRFFILASLRIAGALLVMFGIVVASGNAGAPIWSGYVMVIAGFAILSVGTRRLARRWRTPLDGERR